ncbi:MAG: dihydrodipicolinate synthase family protein [Chloroflexi bacterium]|nr:MAG: dihydrodipicolinate synthase family protein [Chloroflexota bacterium]TME95915.1 MAG: dihydrodipicolinate synthase family protein [Chloroflexota bacterium]
MKLDLEGLIPATILPMTADAEIDEPGLRRYIRHVASAKPKALAINVDTGEGPHLWQKERLRVLELVLDEVGDRIPVVAGLGAQFTAQAVELARETKEIGAAGLLVFPIGAYQGLPLDPELPVRYHAAIGDATGLPLILFQLQPALGGINFDPETLERMCKVAQVVAIKEASFDRRRFVEVREAVKAARPDCVYLTGNDNFIHESFELGAQGALIGFGAVATRQQVELVTHALAGRHDQARRIMERLTPLVDIIFAPPVRNYRARAKAALVMQGIIDRETVRPPLLPISELERERIREALIFAGELDQKGDAAEASA